MKKIYKNILGAILFLIIILLLGSVIYSLVDLMLKDKINNNLILFIKWILIFILITILLKTKTGRNLEESVFGKKFNRKR